MWIKYRSGYFNTTHISAIVVRQELDDKWSVVASEVGGMSEFVIEESLSTKEAAVDYLGTTILGFIDSPSA